MPYLRRLPRIPLNGRVTARLTLQQRDLLLALPSIPKELGAGLAHAAVRNGKLGLELKRAGLDALIMSAGSARPAGKAADRELARLLDYLESLLERFEEPDGDDQP
jgi:hypothetical protein